jgi:hypothetical protein
LTQFLALSIEYADDPKISRPSCSICTSAWRWNAGVKGGKGECRGAIDTNDIDHLTRRQIAIRSAIRFRLRANFTPQRFAPRIPTRVALSDKA